MTPTAATRTKLVQLHPDLRVRVEALILACPTPLGITSAWRSAERQAELYRAWVERRPGANPANPPGRSKHERTLGGQPAAQAADLAVSAWGHWVHQHAGDFGLTFPIQPNPRATTAPRRRGEPWHVESNGRPFTGHDREELPVPPTIREGDTSRHVRTLRGLLMARNHTLTSGVNAGFGPALTEQVKLFQRNLGLEPDGIVGPATWRLLILGWD